MTVRVVLADDEQLLRVGFRMILDAHADFEVVAEAADGRSAVAAAAAHRPDVVVMDVRMPELDGIGATEIIAREYPEVRVLILTTFDLDEYAFAGLRAGASGFLLKNAPPDELVAAIRTVAAGDAVVAPRVTRRLLDTFARRMPTATQAARDQRLAQLTDREREVLSLMAQGMNNASIAKALFLTDRAVEKHINSMFHKLGLTEEPDVHRRVMAVLAFLRETELA